MPLSRHPTRRFVPLTPSRWADFETLFGPRGACAGCWCMWPLLPRSEFERAQGAENRRAMKRIVQANRTPGLIAYLGREPVGWCALAPREAYPRLERSRILQPIDDRPVWSVVCFFVARPNRRRGLATHLLQEAVRFAAKRGAKIVEGYPVEPKGGNSADAFVWTGLASSFHRAGFVEVARRSPTRPIMRCTIGRSATAARRGTPGRVPASSVARRRAGG